MGVPVDIVYNGGPEDGAVSRLPEASGFLEAVGLSLKQVHIYMKTDVIKQGRHVYEYVGAKRLLRNQGST